MQCILIQFCNHIYFLWVSALFNYQLFFARMKILPWEQRFLIMITILMFNNVGHVMLGNVFYCIRFHYNAPNQKHLKCHKWYSFHFDFIYCIWKETELQQNMDFEASTNFIVNNKTTTHTQTVKILNVSKMFIEVEII